MWVTLYLTDQIIFPTHIGVELDDPADDLGREGGLLEVGQSLTCGGQGRSLRAKFMWVTKSVTTKQGWGVS